MLGSHAPVNVRDFLAELKRRRVYNVAIAYCVTGWLLTQIVTQVFPFFDVPNWAVRLVILLIIVGLPVAVVLAWALEVTPEGIQRADALSAKGRAPRAGRKLTAIVVVLAAAAVALFVFQLVRKQSGGRPAESATASVTKNSIAVLPFKPLAAQSRNEFLENGMADTLIAKLSTIRDLVVPAFTSAQKVDQREHDPIAAGRALGVRAVLDGSLQQLGDRLRVTARLVNVGTGVAMWSDTFDEKFTDVFEVQDNIARKVATALALHLSGDQQQRLTKRHTVNPDAYQLYLKGRFYWNKYTQEGFLKAIECYNQALALDPEYALAYAGLADAYIQLGDLTYALPTEFYPKARMYAAKALSLDDNLAQSHVAMGTYLLFYEWKWQEAEGELKRGIELNPSYADAYHFYAHYLESQGRLDEAISTIERAAKLDPLSLIINNEVGWAYYHARKFEPAIHQLRKTLELDPTFYVSVVNLAQSYEGAGEPLVALKITQDALAPSGNWSWLVAEIGCAKADLQDKPGAEAILAELERRSSTELVDPYLVATIYTHLGDRDHAFEYLRKAIEIRATSLVWLDVEPKFDRLREDPRFDDIRRAIGLRVGK